MHMHKYKQPTKAKAKYYFTLYSSNREIPSRQLIIMQNAAIPSKEAHVNKEFPRAISPWQHARKLIQCLY